MCQLNNPSHVNLSSYQGCALCSAVHCGVRTVHNRWSDGEHCSSQLKKARFGSQYVNEDNGDNDNDDDMTMRMTMITCAQTNCSTSSPPASISFPNWPSTKSPILHTNSFKSFIQIAFNPSYKYPSILHTNSFQKCDRLACRMKSGLSSCWAAQEEVRNPRRAFTSQRTLLSSEQRVLSSMFWAVYWAVFWTGMCRNHQSTDEQQFIYWAAAFTSQYNAAYYA